MLAKLAGILREAILPTAGRGVSSTKLVWFTAGMLSTYCATLATIGGVAVYVFLQQADAVYWTAVGALWINALGFSTSAKKHQNTSAKEITLANQQTKEPRAENQGGET